MILIFTNYFLFGIYISKMGGSSSSMVKNTLNQMSKIITDITVNATKSCRGAVVQDQQLQVVAGGDINLTNSSMSQHATLNVSCLQSNEIQASIVNDIQSKIQQLAEATAKNSGIDLPFSGNTDASVENVVNISTEIANRISFNMKSYCIAMVEQRQRVNLIAGGSVVIDDFNMSQTTKAILTCIQTDQVTVDLANKLAYMVTQKGDAKVTKTFPLMPDLNSLFSTAATIGAIALVALIILIVLIILMNKFL